MKNQKILILDFGGQYNQLIARRVRECNVYCEVKPFSTSLEEIKAFAPIGIIFTGGPNSVYEAGSPHVDTSVYSLGVPILGICYGCQLLAHELGGKVTAAQDDSAREYGKTETYFDTSCKLFKNIPAESITWMSHGDYMAQVPQGFHLVAHSAACPTVGICDEERGFYGVQFHPEVNHTVYGSEMLHNFLYEICGAVGDWTMADYKRRAIEEIRAKVGDGKVLLALSGGVDSSVAAYLLQQAGHEVIGLFMINWHDTTGTLEGDCPWHDDRVFAELVAKKLDIPLHVVDLSADYRTRVVDYMFSEYEKGRTPNPDVLCNREIKFDVFLREALKLGADYVATGHYCRKAEETLPDGRTIHKLLAGSDPNKDQSYFLCQLSQEQLSRALFPVGGLLKPEVRRIAEEQGLATAKRKDSQGICFVGKVDLPTFLQQKLAPKKGNIHEILPAWPKYVREEVPAEGEPTTGQLAALAEPWHYTVRDGKKIGEHNGAHYYTIGQRKGLGIGGRRESLFILATDTVQNVIWVGEGDAHPGLWRPALHIAPGEIHWVNPARELTAGQSARFSVRIRYRQPLQGARLFVRDEGAYLVFDRPQRGITPGQFAAWYDGDQLVGSGVIEG